MVACAAGTAGGLGSAHHTPGLTPRITSCLAPGLTPCITSGVPAGLAEELVKLGVELLLLLPRQHLRCHARHCCTRRTTFNVSNGIGVTIGSGQRGIRSVGVEANRLQNRVKTNGTLHCTAGCHRVAPLCNAQDRTVAAQKKPGTASTGGTDLKRTFQFVRAQDIASVCPNPNAIVRSSISRARRKVSCERASAWTQ